MNPPEGQSMVVRSKPVPMKLHDTLTLTNLVADEDFKERAQAAAERDTLLADWLRGIALKVSSSELNPLATGECNFNMDVAATSRQDSVMLAEVHECVSKLARRGFHTSGKFKEHLIESVGCGQLPAIERDDCILDAINVLLDDHAGASWPIDTGAKRSAIAADVVQTLCHLGLSSVRMQVAVLERFALLHSLLHLNEEDRGDAHAQLRKSQSGRAAFTIDNDPNTDSKHTIMTKAAKKMEEAKELDSMRGLLNARVVEQTESLLDVVDGVVGGIEGKVDSLQANMQLSRDAKSTQKKCCDCNEHMGKKCQMQFLGSVVPMVAKAPVVVLSCTLFFTVVVMKEQGNTWLIEAPKDALVPGVTFLSFLCVFYGHQVYTRWVSQYNTAMVAVHAIIDLATILRACTSTKGTKTASQILRYVNVAHIMGYVAQPKSAYDSDFCLAMVTKHNLLSEVELAKIDSALRRGVGSKEATVWALQCLHRLNKSRAVKLPGPILGSIQGKIMAVQDTMMKLNAFDQQPIPYAYYNLLSWLLWLFLPGYSYMIAINFHHNYLTAWMPVFATNLSLMGLNAVALQLGNPFGDDILDFPVLSWLDRACNESRSIIHETDMSLAPVVSEDGITVQYPAPKADFDMALRFASAPMVLTTRAIKKHAETETSTSPLPGRATDKYGNNHVEHTDIEGARPTSAAKASTKGPYGAVQDDVDPAPNQAGDFVKTEPDDSLTVMFGQGDDDGDDDDGGGF